MNIEIRPNKFQPKQIVIVGRNPNNKAQIVSCYCSVIACVTPTCIDVEQYEWKYILAFQKTDMLSTLSEEFLNKEDWTPDGDFVYE